MTINLIYVFFAFGIFVSIIGWIGFGLVKIAALRVFLRSACVSIFATPSIIIGHGFAPAPALMVMTFKDHFFLGLIPILIVWFITSILHGFDKFPCKKFFARFILDYLSVCYKGSKNTLLVMT